jgi:hypothetical protein
MLILMILQAAAGVAGSGQAALCEQLLMQRAILPGSNIPDEIFLRKHQNKRTGMWQHR